LKLLKTANKVIIEGVKSHHEHYSGTGYPDHLKGESIPLCARVIAIADALDAMIFPRPYRINPLPIDDALTEIQINAGAQFDPVIIEKIMNQQEQLFTLLLNVKCKEAIGCK
jgi:HD-GYP domain-containing protein (c-di-GMP phosphodiesterase class II)